MSKLNSSERKARDTESSGSRLGPDPVWWRRQQEVIAQGCLTNSKHPSAHIYGVTPTHIDKASGATVWDHNGRQYVDFICGYGVNLFGYGNHSINQAAEDGVRKYGDSCSLATPCEVIAAEKLCEMFCFVDKWKFLKSGSTACKEAIKIARSHTGRSKVLTHGYHGHDSEFVSLTPPADGCDGEFNIANLSGYSGDYSDIAAVIIEPVITTFDYVYLTDLRERTKKAGAVLIFDEVITAFRYENFSVASASGIIPDLFIIGKSSANGKALSAIGGKEDIMDGHYFTSTTFAGEVGPLAACAQVCDLLQKGYPYAIDDLWKSGKRWLDYFNSLWPEKIRINGYPTRGVFVGDDQVIAKFFQESVYAGMLFCKSWFYSFAHRDHEQETLIACKDIFTRIKRGEVDMLGRPPTSPFSMKGRTDGISKGS